MAQSKHTTKVRWKTHRDGIWPMDIANVASGQIVATQYEKRLSRTDPFKRRRYWHWSITNRSGRKIAEGHAPNRREARQNAEAAIAKAEGGAS